MPLELDCSDLVSLGLDPAEADLVKTRIAQLPDAAPAELWRQISREVLHPEIPFPVHEFLHNRVFSKQGVADSLSAPAWFPEDPQESNIGRLMKHLDKSTYQDLYRWSVEEKAAFWRVMIERLGIAFEKAPDSILDTAGSVEQPSWLAGARMNIIDSCFCAHPDSTAVVCQQEGGDLTKVTVAELRSLAFRVARSLVDMGVKSGDRVGVIMPMTLEASAVYLGAIAAGCAVTTVADIFAPEEMRTRLEITKPVCVFTQDHILRRGRRRPLYDRVRAAGSTRNIVIPAEGVLDSGIDEHDMPWERFLSDNDSFSPVAAVPETPITILFSSGTTADPKAIPWNHLTPIKAAVDGHLHHDIQPGDVVCWPTNLGWMMGPWLLFAGLINRAAVALYYGAPTSIQFGQFVQDAGVTMLGLVPSIVAVWKSSNCLAGFDWSRVRVFSSTGECSNPQHMLFLMSTAGYKPVIEYCGGTEIGGGYISGTVVQPSIPGTFSTPALGSELVILDETGRASDFGELHLVPPAIGLSQDLLNADHHEVYYQDVPNGPGGRILRRHGDQFERLPNGYYRARGRVDDTMNLGGIKVSSIQVEEIVGMDQDISEAAAIGVPPPNGGPDKLVIYAVPVGSDPVDTARLKTRMQRLVRDKISVLFKIHDVVLIESLPRTASNKIVRRQLREDYMRSGRSDSR